MTVGTGEALCLGCGYEYDPKKGDPDYPVPPGTMYQVSTPKSTESTRNHTYLKVLQLVVSSKVYMCV